MTECESEVRQSFFLHFGDLDLNSGRGDIYQRAFKGSEERGDTLSKKTNKALKKKKQVEGKKVTLNEPTVRQIIYH